MLTAREKLEALGYRLTIEEEPGRLRITAIKKYVGIVDIVSDGECDCGTDHIKAAAIERGYKELLNEVLADSS